MLNRQNSLVKQFNLPQSQNSVAFSWSLGVSFPLEQAAEVALIAERCAVIWREAPPGTS